MGSFLSSDAIKRTKINESAMDTNKLKVLVERKHMAVQEDYGGQEMR